MENKKTGKTKKTAKINATPTVTFLKKKLKYSPLCIVRKNNDETISLLLMNSDATDMFNVTGTAAHIFKLIKNGEQVSKVIDRVAAQLNQSSKSLEKPAISFLKKCVQLGVLTH